VYKPLRTKENPSDGKCALALCVCALCILLWAAKNLEPEIDQTSRLNNS
jgi:hypothetical protein